MGQAAAVKFNLSQSSASTLQLGQPPPPPASPSEVLPPPVELAQVSGLTETGCLAASSRLEDPPAVATLSAAVSGPASQEKSTQVPGAPSLGKVFVTTFITIFLAEMGDKTQVSTLLMTAESHAPWVVFAGAATALIATSIVGVLVGRWLAKRLSPRTLDTAAGLMLALIALWLIWDVLQIG